MQNWRCCNMKQFSFFKHYNYPIKIAVSIWLWVGMCEVGWEKGDRWGKREKKKIQTHRHLTISKQYRLLQEWNASIIFNNNIQKSYCFKKYKKFPSRRSSVTDFQDNKIRKIRDHKIAGQPFQQAHPKEENSSKSDTVLSHWDSSFSPAPTLAQ